MAVGLNQNSGISTLTYTYRQTLWSYKPRFPTKQSKGGEQWEPYCADCFPGLCVGQVFFVVVVFMYFCFLQCPEKQDSSTCKAGSTIAVTSFSWPVWAPLTVCHYRAAGWLFVFVSLTSLKIHLEGFGAMGTWRVVRWGKFTLFSHKECITEIL